MDIGALALVSSYISGRVVATGGSNRLRACIGGQTMAERFRADWDAVVDFGRGARAIVHHAERLGRPTGVLLSRIRSNNAAMEGQRTTMLDRWDIPP
jgi:hypothetical protein